jgi:hypothetical protein
MKNFSQDSWSLGLDLNPGISKYKAEMLTTELLHLVSDQYNFNLTRNSDF